MADGGAGDTDGLADGTITLSIVLSPVGGVAAGEFITATATRADGTFSNFFDTSEFAQNVVAVLSGSIISGTIYHDVDGDADIAEGGTLTFTNATVKLYLDDGDGVIDAGDSLVTTTTTDGSGNYSFGSLSDATYYITVDSKTLAATGYNGGFDINDIWAEQTYAVTGAAIGAGFSGADGALYGGRNAGTSDDAAAITTAEHVIRVTVAGADVNGVDAGFSFNAVVNTLAGDNQDDDAVNNRTVQGSLRQFIQNANAISGANAMRFVPVVATNASDGGGNNWWRLTVIQPLPALTDADTTIDGRGYSSADGVTVLDTNSAILGFVGTVGLGADAAAGTGDEPTLSGVQGPEFEIVEDGASQVDQGLDLQANNLTVRRIAIHGFGDDNPNNADLFTEADIRIGTAVGSDVGSAFTGILVEDNVIGSGPAALADPGAPDQSVNGIAVYGPDNGTIQRNAIAYAGRFGVFLSNDADGWTVQSNDIRENALINAAQDGLDLGNLSGGTTVSGNYFYRNWGGGLDSYRGAGGNLIENNSFLENGRGQTEPSAVRLFGMASTVRLNLIQNNGVVAGAPPLNRGSGVLVVQNDGTTNTPAIGNLISQNSFGSNISNAIDLVPSGGDNSLGDGITLNDSATDANAGNIGLDYPVIAAALFNAGTTTVSGTTCAGCDVEVYLAVAGSGDTDTGIDYGEGVTYIGTNTADGGGNWSLSTAVLAIGNVVSAIAIDGANNTSEFGVNATVTGDYSISGTVYHDVDADADVAEVGTLIFDGATVQLYQDSGNAVIDGTETLIATTTTDGSGNYSFGGLGDGTYYIVVGPTTLAATAYNGGFDINDVWAEQTYAVSGAASGAVFTATAGALYGGRNQATSDDPADVTSAEHVVRRTIVGADATGVNFGFSFNPVVNTRGDATDDDGGRTNRLQQDSLRQFILNANAISGSQTAEFAIGAEGSSQSIAQSSVLPTISDTISLDGWTQGAAGYTGPPLIEIDGTGAGAVSALTFNGVNSSGSTVRGLIINRFASGTAIRLFTSSNNVIAGNYLGISASGDAPQGNQVGIFIQNGASNQIGGSNATERNVISANTVDGIQIIGAAATNNTVAGNYIGLDSTGAVDLGNTNQGVAIFSSANNNTIGGTVAGSGNVISGNNNFGIGLSQAGTTDNTIQGNIIGLAADGTTIIGNTIGGLAAGARNIISGNNAEGVDITGAGTSNNEVIGNYIGLAVDGTTAVGNGVVAGNGDGVQLANGATNNTVGGTVAGARNIISGGLDDGVEIKDAGTASNVVLGNWIGLDATGASQGNADMGVVFSNSTTNNTLGGTAAGAGNAVSGNTVRGVYIVNSGTDGNIVQGNIIGLDPTASAARPNGGDGVHISQGAANNLIGGTAADTGNIIAMSGDDGVQVSNASPGNSILGNSIYGHNTDGTTIGIDLNILDGPDPNDGATNAAQPNNGMDLPVISTAILSGGNLTLDGYVGNMPASPTFVNARVEFFISSNNPTGWGEGQTYLGFLTTNASSQFSGSIAVAGVNVGDEITATATDPAGNTSEFALNVAVTANLTISGTIYEDIDGNAQSGDFSGRNNATVRLFRDGGDGLANGVDDTFLTSTLTAGGGIYSFTGLSNGTYWVVVDSKNIFPTQGTAAPSSVWAEQTYGVAGAMNGAASFLGANGALYGGRDPNVSDSSTNAPASLATSEHVTRVVVAGSDISGIDSAFSFNVVTNVRGDGGDDDGAGTGRHSQGTLDQFIMNANLVNGANAMRFVPAVLTNAAGGGGNWWQINPASTLGSITDADTTIDGRAYDQADGIAVVDSNPGLLGSVGPVGVDALALLQVARPELEIADTTGINMGLYINANDVSVRRLSIWGFGQSFDPANNNNANIQIGNVTGAIIEENVIGTPPDGFTDPGASRTLGPNIRSIGGDSGTIRNNLIGFSRSVGIYLSTNADSWLIEGNEIRENAIGNAPLDGIDLPENSISTTIRGNLITDNIGVGVDMYRGGGQHTIENNTITNHGSGGVEDPGIRLFGPNSTVQKNIITANAGNGVMIVNSTGGGSVPLPYDGNLISQNHIYNNGKLGIDLHTGAENRDLGTAPYVIPNDGPNDPDSGANLGQNFPVITSAVWNGANTVIEGTLNSISGTTFDIEIYSNTVCNGDATGTPQAQTNGEGETYRLTVNNVTTDGSGNATFNTNIAADLTGLYMTATTINPATNDTSEFSACAQVAVPATIEFELAAASDQEANGGNIPRLIVNGTLTTAQTIEVNVTGDTAEPRRILPTPPS